MPCSHWQITVLGGGCKQNMLIFPSQLRLIVFVQMLCNGSQALHHLLKCGHACSQGAARYIVSARAAISTRMAVSQSIYLPGQALETHSARPAKLQRISEQGVRKRRAHLSWRKKKQSESRAPSPQPIIHSSRQLTRKMFLLLSAVIINELVNTFIGVV